MIDLLLAAALAGSKPAPVVQPPVQPLAKRRMPFRRAAWTRRA